MIGSAMVTMATELFCLNKLLENLRYFHVVFLSVDLQHEILIQNAVQILAIFHNIKFFLKNYFYFFSLKFYLLCLMFCLSDILWQRIT
jgi:hypothetical protein